MAQLRLIWMPGLKSAFIGFENNVFCLSRKPFDGLKIHHFHMTT